MEGRTMRLIAIFCIMASCSMADTNKVEKVDKPDKAEKPVKPEKIEKEKKLQHDEKKITIKERDKGSKKESDWKPAKEYPLMFGNNRKARPKK
jgi:hypothetical protein